MLGGYAAALAAFFLATPAVAQRPLPEDVARFIERRDACDHFRGEDAYDAERRRFLEQQTLKLCVGSDKELARLKAKYEADGAVMAKLGQYESEIEPPSPRR